MVSVTQATAPVRSSRRPAHGRDWGGSPTGDPSVALAVSGRHLPALDGLRAIAVAGVLAYHLGSGGPRGATSASTCSSCSRASSSPPCCSRSGPAPGPSLGAFWGSPGPAPAAGPVPRAVRIVAVRRVERALRRLDRGGAGRPAEGCVATPWRRCSTWPTGTPSSPTSPTSPSSRRPLPSAHLDAGDRGAVLPGVAARAAAAVYRGCNVGAGVGRGCRGRVPWPRPSPWRCSTTLVDRPGSTTAPTPGPSTSSPGPRSPCCRRGAPQPGTAGRACAARGRPAGRRGAGRVLGDRRHAGGRAAVLDVPRRLPGLRRPGRRGRRRCPPSAPGPLGRRGPLSRRAARSEISYGLYLWHWPVIVYLDPERTGCRAARSTSSASA